MAHITSFTIAGLAGRPEPYEQSLKRDVNVFFGLNGSGKTSLLKILHSALSGDATILTSTPFIEATVHIHSLDRSRDFTKHITKASLARTTKEIHTLGGVRTRVTFSEDASQWSTTPVGTGRDRWGHTYLPTTRLAAVPVRTPLDFDDDNAEVQFDTHFAQLLKRLWSQYYAEVLQTVRSAQERGLVALLQEILAPGRSDPSEPPPDLDTACRRVLTFLGRQSSKARTHRLPVIDLASLKARYQKEQQIRNVVDHLNAVEAQIESAMQPRTRIQELVNRLFSNKRIAFADEDIDVSSLDEKTIPLASLSSGEKHILRLLIETLRHRNNPIIIDEPELSLHIDWQRELLPALRELVPNRQLIVATHSPEVMVDVPDDNIYRL